jgi:hypothetical protein
VVWALLAGLILFQLTTTAVFVREDPDDVLYLSEVLDLAGAPAMRIEEPTHRGEGLPPTRVYAWQAWELWGATLCQLTGLHPLVAFRVVLPLLLILLAYPVYAALARRILPAAGVPIALLVLAAYYTFGMSSHWSGANFFLPRAQQGKSFLIHVGAPALVLLATSYLSRPRLGTLVLLLLASFAALGWAPTATFLAPSVLLAIGLAHVALHGLRREAVFPYLAYGLTVLPQLCFGVYLAVDPNVLLGALSEEQLGWIDAVLFRHLNFEQGGGAIELLALIALPLALPLLRSRREWTYPVAFTAAFLVTLGNPVLQPFLADHVTSVWGYDRLFWAIPFGLLLGTLAAGLALPLARTAGPTTGPALALVVAIAALPALGGHYVWGEANVYFANPALPPSYRTTNVYKMPEGLLPIADALLETPLGPEHRILCSERTAGHLAPYAHDFDFVYTRYYQTDTSLRLAGHPEREVHERRSLGRAFLEGRLEPALAEPLLLEHRAWSVVLDHREPELERQLETWGFARRIESGPYSLWLRIDAEGAAIRRVTSSGPR